jgi:hypothetical protein
MQKKMRSFTVVRVIDKYGKKKGSANLHGRFRSKTPVGAAKKSFTRICNKSAIKGQCAMNISVQETTRGSKHKEFSYKIIRKRSPTLVQHGKKQVVHRYKNIAKSLARAPSPSPKRSRRKPVQVTRVYHTRARSRSMRK